MFILPLLYFSVLYNYVWWGCVVNLPLLVTDLAIINTMMTVGSWPSGK